MRFLAVVIFLLYSLSPVSASDYLLGAGDHIKIVVYDESDLTTTLKIDRSGLLSFPFLSDIKVIGLSMKQLENRIKRGLLDGYLVNPQVTVSILDYRPFFIHGQVMKPGGFPYQEDLRLDKAIALAGGLTSRASKVDWKITRVINGKSSVIKVGIADQVEPDDIIEIEQSFF
ncbi:MAG: polysaccharide export protein [Colwellia sp.]